MSVSTLEHNTYGGRTLRFEQWDDLYRVNRRQSLLLATNALIEALDLSVSMGLRPSEMRAWEPCCGGAPVAIVLKDAGLGHVEASDVDPRALRACRRNAELNAVDLDRVFEFDVLGPNSPSGERFDLIACNPPCRPSDLIPDQFPTTLRNAVDGGDDGCRFYSRIIERAGDWLRPGGRLVLVLTSTVEVRVVVAALNARFRGAWRTSYATPVAQPFAPIASPESARAVALASLGKILIWDGRDGWLWRLSWVLTAMATQGPTREASPDGLRHLSFLPYGGEPVEEEFGVAVARFIKGP